MLIKRKYTISSKQNEEELSKKEVQPSGIKTEAESDAQSKKQKEDINLQKEKPDEKTEQIKPPENNIPEKKITDDDFDLSIENIKFAQREERRNGSRRCGYRRMQDRNIISRAQEDAKAIKEQAKLDGYKEGITQAEQDIEQLRGKFAEFYGYKDLMFDKVSECIYDISAEIAKKILNREIETDKTAVIQMIKSAVEEVNKTENKIILKVMPQDVEIVKNKLPEIFTAGGFEAAISVLPDKNIKEGGVIVETSNGIIDATISTQMAIMEKALCAGKEVKE